MRALRWAGAGLAVGFGVYFLVFWPLRDPHPRVRLPDRTLAVVNVRIYPSPDARPVERGTVLVRAGRIVAVGPDVSVPPEAQILSCGQCTVTAGFWNAHIHFTEPKWNFAAWKSAATLNAQLAEMLTSRGFTTVVDAGSDPRITLSLRRRIELPFYARWLLAQPSTPAAAAKIERRNIARGADLLKLFTGSYVAQGRVLPMPRAVAQAAVTVAHAHGQLAYSHASNLAGTQVAIESGVDLLAHAPDIPDGIDAALLRRMVDRRMSMIPTLKMFGTTVTPDSAYLRPIYEVIRQFRSFGGELLFGTMSVT